MSYLRRWMPLWVLLAASMTAFAQRSDTLRIMSYNLLNFPGSDGNTRVANFRKTLNYCRIDVLLAGEIISYAGMNILRDQALNAYGGTDWAYVPFVDGPDTDMGLFYKQSAVRFLGSQTITTELRNVYVYHLQPATLDSTTDFYVYGMHLKASNTSSDAAQRQREATIVRNHANSLPSGARFMYTGDMNLYTSAEGAYQVFIQSQTNNVGRAFDPLPAGAWNNNSSFRYIHTQSPRTRDFGGGTTGGMDDRFDFILPSMTLNGGTSSRYIVDSYRTVGNDGNHMNDSINRRPNTAVPDSIADALHYGADHLPVYADFVFVERNSSAEEPRTPALPGAFTLSSYPNPFNHEATIQIHLSRELNIRVDVLDSSGRRVQRLATGKYSGELKLKWNASGRSSGTYFVRVVAENEVQMIPLSYLK